jgi:hypothetical protein
LALRRVPPATAIASGGRKGTPKNLWRILHISNEKRDLLADNVAIIRKSL